MKSLTTKTWPLRLRNLTRNGLSYPCHPITSYLSGWILYIANRPSLRFLAVSTDGSKIKMKWLERHEEDLGDLSLKDLIHLLERDPQNT